MKKILFLYLFSSGNNIYCNYSALSYIYIMYILNNFTLYKKLLKVYFLLQVLYFAFHFVIIDLHKASKK